MRFLVTKQGDVYSFLQGKKKKLKPNADKNGYLHIGLFIETGKRKWFRIHRLVAEKYVPNPNNYPQVNHKDGNKQNNYYKNLEWCTCKHNIRHSWANGLAKPYDRSKPYNRQGIIDSNKRRANHGT